MSGTITGRTYSNLHVRIFWGGPLLWVIFIFLLFSSSWGVVGQNTTIPTYSWLKQEKLPTVNVNLATLSVNSEDITIAVATDPEGNVYTLTFGKGVTKRNSEGVLLNDNFIPANILPSPLDLAIDQNGYLYVATYLPEGEYQDNGQIKVFDTQGNFVRSILTSFYRPMGLDVDENFVYAAEYYDGKKGPEQGSVYSRIRIYNKLSGSLVKESNQVQIPMRIAIDSNKNVYVSQAGYSNNSEIRIFNENLIYQTVLPNITSPGSIVIDEFDFIHVIEYAGRIDFSRFIDFESLSFSEVQTIAKNIDDAQRAKAFSIKIFDPNRSLKLTFKDQIDFPVDLTFNHCDRMYVNNAKIFGNNVFIIGYLPDRLEFDLEIYKRSPSFDQEAPVIDCPADIVVTAAPGETTAVVNYTAPIPTDNCSTIVPTRAGPAPGSNFPVGTTTITYTAKDDAGNISTCSFKITVNPAEEVEDKEPPVITCPSAITRNVDPRVCGASVIYPTPIATDNSGSATVTLKSGPASGSMFPVGITTVTFEAIDAAENKAECSFTVTVIDNENPTISCRTNITETVVYGESGKVITYTSPVFNDNCAGFTMVQTAGLASGATFPVGSTTNSFEVTDASGKTVTCSFTVTLTEGSDTEKPKITCPSNITQNVDSNKCGAVVTYPLPTASDNSGNATVRLKSGIAPGEIFPVGTTTVTYEATDAAGNTDECSFTITVIDNIPPSIVCPDNIGVKVDSGQDYAVVTFPNATTTDNCSATVLQTQGSPSGSQFPQGTHTIEFTATDVSGNKTTCSFTITVSGEDQPEPPVFKDCPSNITRGTEINECGAIVNFPTPTASTSDGAVGVNLTSALGPGDFFPVGTTIVTFKASGSGSTVVECQIEVVVRDSQKPQFTNPCQGVVYTAGFEITEGFEVPDFSDDFGPYDNCDTNLEIVQVPAPGTLIYSEGTHPVTLTIKDQAGNSNTCTFEMSITAMDSFDLICNSEIRIPANDRCEFILPDLTEEYYVYPPSAVITQSLPAGELLTEDTEVVITATYNNEVQTCVIKIRLVDYIWPEITCLSSQNVPFTPSQGFVIPNYVEEVIATDNCEIVNVTQNIPVGTIIREDTIVQITAKDNFGNLKDCFVYIYLQKEEEERLEITCPEEQEGQLNNLCVLSIPDYTESASVNLEGATIIQTPAPGDLVSDNTLITLTASLGEETVICTFNLVVSNSILPEITCPGTKTEFYNPEDGFVLPNYRNLAEVTGDCGIAEITQTPSPGTVIFSNTQVKIVVTSTSNLIAYCEFMVNLSEEEVLEITCIGDQEEEWNANCQLAVPDYTSRASVNFSGASVTQSPAAGTLVSGETVIKLTATLNGETDVCSFMLLPKDLTPPVANCVTGYEIWLNENGTATLNASEINLQSTDNCEISEMNINKTTFTTADIGENEIILIVTDGAGNTNTCNTTIIVNAYDGGTPDFTCRTDVILPLDASGNAILEVSQLYTGDAAGRTFSLSRENFNCSNIGNNEVTLSWTSSEGPGSCTVNVVIKDETPPVVRTKNISMFLSQTGQVQLSAFLFDDGSSDNCGSVTLSIDKTSLSCKDVGQNVVTITATDSSGNTSTGTATVTLTGDCEEPEQPRDPNDYIYIYPNPSTGPITFRTPSKIKIEKVEVYDYRGRFIMAQDFSESVIRYQMDLTGLQQSVYILNVITTEGTRILRVIIK